MRLREGARIAVIGAGPSGSASASCASRAIRPTSRQPSRARTSSRRASLCQDYLAQVRDGTIACRPGIASISGRTATFADGSTETLDAIVCATGYDVDIPYLAPAVRDRLGPDLALYHRTFHPDLPGLGVIGQFLAQGPYFPLLELQARWIAAVWSGEAALPGPEAMRRTIARPRPRLDAHNALALTLSEQLGVAPDPDEWPDLREQLAGSPRAAVDPADLEALHCMATGSTTARAAT